MIAALVLTLALTSGERAATIPLHNERGVLFLQATVNRSAPLLFVFDPGAGDLYTRAARNSMKRGARQTICLSRACFATALEYFPGDPQALDPRHDASLGAIAGSLGPQLLRRYAARIDYGASTLTLIPPAQFRVPGSARRFALKLDSYGLPLVTASVDGVAGSFELDLRAPTSMLFSPFLMRSGLRKSYAPLPVVKQSGARVAHSIRRVGFAETNLRGVPFWFSTDASGKFANAEVAGLLGNNVLSHFVVTLDYHHGYIYLQRVKG